MFLNRIQRKIEWKTIPILTFRSFRIQPLEYRHGVQLHARSICINIMHLETIHNNATSSTKP